MLSYFYTLQQINQSETACPVSVHIGTLFLPPHEGKLLCVPMLPPYRLLMLLQPEGARLIPSLL
jgi:hypothetical protein